MGKKCTDSQLHELPGLHLSMNINSDIWASSTRLWDNTDQMNNRDFYPSENFNDLCNYVSVHSLVSLFVTVLRQYRKKSKNKRTIIGNRLTN